MHSEGASSNIFLYLFIEYLIEATADIYEKLLYWRRSLWRKLGVVSETGNPYGFRGRIYSISLSFLCHCPQSEIISSVRLKWKKKASRPGNKEQNQGKSAQRKAKGKTKQTPHSCTETA